MVVKKRSLREGNLFLDRWIGMQFSIPSQKKERHVSSCSRIAETWHTFCNFALLLDLCTFSACTYCHAMYTSCCWSSCVHCSCCCIVQLHLQPPSSHASTVACSNILFALVHLMVIGKCVSGFQNARNVLETVFFNETSPLSILLSLLARSHIKNVCKCEELVHEFLWKTTVLVKGHMQKNDVEDTGVYI